MQAFLPLLGKDLRLFFRDRTALAFTLLLPILLASVMGSAMSSMMGGGGGGGSVPKVSLLVQDLDGTPESLALFEALGEADGLRVSLSEDARRSVRNGDAPAGLIIPAGYGELLAAGEVPETRLLRDSSASISQQVISGNLVFALGKVQLRTGGPALMTSMLKELGFAGSGLAMADTILASTWTQMEDLTVDLEESGGSEAPAEGVALGMDFLTDGPSLLGVVTEDVAGDSKGKQPGKGAGVSHAFAAMAVMMLMFNLVAAGGGLLDEEASGSMLRLRLSPAGGLALLFAKFSYVFLVGMMQLVVLFLFGWLVFGLPLPPHALAVSIVSIALCLAVAGMGMVFATACRSRKQLEGVSTVVILIMSAMGGAWFPREITPEWFRTLGNFTVTAWAMDAYHGALWYGKELWPTAGLDGIGVQVLVLLGFAVAFTAISVSLFRRRYGTAG